MDYACCGSPGLDAVVAAPLLADFQLALREPVGRPAWRSAPCALLANSGSVASIRGETCIGPTAGIEAESFVTARVREGKRPWRG